MISDEVYAKIHLSRADIIKKKEKDKSKEAGHDHAAADHAETNPAAGSSVAPSELDKLEKAAPAAKK